MKYQRDPSATPASPLRRRLMAGTALAAAVPSVTFGAEPPKPKRLVVNSSGGVTSKALKNAYFDEFEKRYGIPILNTSPADTAKLKVMVESGNVEWDVTEIVGQDGLLVQNLGLLEPINRSIVDFSDFPAEMQDNEFLFPRVVYSTVLGYRTDKNNGQHPVGWKEFWDVKRFPGRRSLRNHPIDNLEYALLADGVGLKDLYPLDVDRAFAKLDEIRPHISVWWTSGAQPAQLLIDGEVIMASGWNGRFYDLMLKGAPVAIEWAGGAVKRSNFGIPKGAKNLYWSQKFLALMTEPKLQAIYANELGYPGLSKESIKYVKPEVAPHLATYPKNLEQQFYTNDKWWAENDAAMRERWNRWMLKS